MQWKMSAQGDQLWSLGGQASTPDKSRDKLVASQRSGSLDADVMRDGG